MTIYDIGCLGPPGLGGKILSALPGAIAVFAVFVGLAALGAAVNRSKRFQAHDICSGWGVITTAMTLAAVTSVAALPYATCILGLAMAAALVPAVKNRLYLSPFWLLAIFPGLFFLVAINIAGISRWDDFSHWVPNALYLFQYDSVPKLSLPPPHSYLPSYPYALPFLTYMTSHLAGGFLVQGGAMINFLLLAAFAAMLMQASATVERRVNTNTIGLFALALLSATLANPGFNASFTITNEADTPTAVLTGFGAILLWRMATSLKEKNRHEIAALTLPLIFTGITMVLVKQSNVALLGLLGIGFMLVAIKNGILKPALRPFVLLIIPALILRSVWQYYASVDIAGKSLALAPFSAWRFDLLGPLLTAVVHTMLKKSGLSVMMLGVTAYGVWGIFRAPTPRRNFAIIASVVYAGYIGFLIISYIGVNFGEGEIRRAASFYRYSTHTSLLGVAMLWLAAPHMWKWFQPKIRAAVPALSAAGRFFTARPAGVALLVAFLPIAFALHAAWIVPQISPAVCADRILGRKIATALPDHARVAVWEPESEGLFTFITNLEFALQSAQRDKTLHVAWSASRSRASFDARQSANYLDQIEHDPDVTALLVPRAERDPVTIAGYGNRQGPLLLERRGDTWKPLNP